MTAQDLLCKAPYMTLPATCRASYPIYIPAHLFFQAPYRIGRTKRIGSPFVVPVRYAIVPVFDADSAAGLNGPNWTCSATGKGSPINTRRFESKLCANNVPCRNNNN